MTKRIARHGRTMNSVSTKRFPFYEDITPSPQTLLMIQMAKDLGFEAYWAGDRAKFGDLTTEQYEMIENLVTVYSWKRDLDE